MPQPTGFNLPLPLPRRLMTDFLHFASQVPTVPVQRRMDLGALVAARRVAVPRPGWCALFTKAWAIVCARHPVLRRAYLGGLFPCLYQHPINVATIAVERPYAGEEAVFFAQITRPEERSLAEIDERLAWFKDRPLTSAAALRRQLRLARLPWPVRRLIWRAALNLNGRLRARFFGTFGVSGYAGLGASSLHPRGLLTSTLSYGTVEPDGGVDVRVIYDHRVMDGSTVARALADLERVLTHEIVAELGYLRAFRVA
ncbi:MAG: hypothetical protein U0736_11795 [Gemmataceae bacterium]